VLSSQPLSISSPRHPPPESIHQLWQIFIDRIDPITKVVHIPTLRPAIEKAISNVETVPRNFEALLFAIYAAAVMSLNGNECEQEFGESRKSLLSRYVSATKAALSRAKFMATTSLVVLQALVIHLLAVRDIYEPRAIWSLTGVAVRIAESMGLERDGVYLGLAPFESEIRRRVWWLLKTHDFRTAELCGLAKFRDLDTSAESTKGPTNVNDDQLFPGMTLLMAESNTLTDVGFVAMRHELATFAAARIAKFRQQGKSSSQFHLHASGNDKIDIEDAFKEVEEILEMKYLRYCDPSLPLHLMVMLIARLSINVIRFLTHHPRRWASIQQTPSSERQWIWEVSINLLEQHNMAQSNPLLRRFAWHAPYFQQWHAFIHVLDTLRTDPLLKDAEKAWQLIGNIYEHTPNMISNTKKPIHIAVGNLCLKAYGDREAAMRTGNKFLPPTPNFISQLRQQREVAKTKRETRDAASRQVENLINHGQTKIHNMSPRSDDGAIDLDEALESTTRGQAASAQAPNSNQTWGTAEDDTFWFVNGFIDSHLGDIDQVMNTDPDFSLAQEHDATANTGQVISWEQWDAWLADSNLMGPTSSAWNLGPEI
jgi:hypothetical protein